MTMASYKKRAIPQASRRALAIRYGCQPGSSIPLLTVGFLISFDIIYLYD